MKKVLCNGGGWEAPLTFFENRKKYPDFGKKKALIVSIFGLNIPLKMKF